MEKLIIEVRINEYASRKHNPNVPFSPDEICHEALQCWRQGGVRFDETCEVLARLKRPHCEDEAVSSWTR